MDGQFVEPNDVNGILGNALIEIHFSFKHYRIQREGEKGFDSFTANIKQINILKRGAAKEPNPYKRRNPRDGPFNVKRAKLTLRPAEIKTSAPKGKCYVDLLQHLTNRDTAFY